MATGLQVFPTVRLNGIHLVSVPFKSVLRQLPTSTAENRRDEKILMPLKFDTSVKCVHQAIVTLKATFDALKCSTMSILEKQSLTVVDVADTLTSLSTDEDEYFINFLERYINELFEATSMVELFRTMNNHWSYLDPNLLNKLVKELNLKDVKQKMDTYMSDIQQFRKNTPLLTFVRTQQKRKLKLSAEFFEAIAGFDWDKEGITLEDVEIFRQENASHYSPDEFFMMVALVKDFI